jgi:hypothetical protein
VSSASSASTPSSLVRPGSSSDLDDQRRAEKNQQYRVSSTWRDFLQKAVHAVRVDGPLAQAGSQESVGREGIEPPQPEAADLQSAPSSHRARHEFPRNSNGLFRVKRPFPRRVSCPFCSARSREADPLLDLARGFASFCLKSRAETHTPRNLIKPCLLTDLSPPRLALGPLSVQGNEAPLRRRSEPDDWWVTWDAPHPGSHRSASRALSHRSERSLVLTHSSIGLVRTH